MTPFEQSILAEFDRLERRIKAEAPDDPDFYFNTVMYVVSASLGCACGVLSAVEHKTPLEAYNFIVDTLREKISSNPKATSGENVVPLKRKLSS